MLQHSSVAFDGEKNKDGAPVLSVHRLRKSFSGKTVVNDLTFDLHPGEALALVGENGAGKSTTKNMLCGLLQPTGGTIHIDGLEVHRIEAAEQRIAAVHQELSLFGTLTVAENMCIAQLPGNALRIDRREADRIARDQLNLLGIEIDPKMLVEELGVGKQQIVEIAKALLRANRVLILDEPTTSLTAPEREKLFEIIDMLKKRGLAIIFISHFMEEIYRVCDTYVALRDGQQVGSGRLTDVQQSDLEAMMVGRTVGQDSYELAPHGDEELLRVEGLSSEDFHDISFSVRKGEIMGIAGLMGAGRTEVAESIYGLRRATGRIFVKGNAVPTVSVKEMKRRRVCYVTEDRRTNGLFLNRPVRENLTAGAVSRFVRRTVAGIGFPGERAGASKVVSEMNIALPHIENQVIELSGGNQQKVLLGRSMATEPEIFLFDEPTKGVDIGAKFDIHRKIAALAERGAAVVIVSSDLQELLNLTHRLLVMRQGRFAGGFERKDYDSVKIISLAASAAQEGA